MRLPAKFVKKKMPPVIASNVSNIFVKDVKEVIRD